MTQRTGAFGSAADTAVPWRPLLLLPALFLLAACKAPRDVAPVLALQSIAASNPADQGWTGLVSTRLRAIRGLQVQARRADCGSDGVTHVLEMERRTSDRSEITAFRLVHCVDRRASSKSFVTPRDARRDWSRAAAWWVAQELGLTQAAPGEAMVLGERAMLHYLAAVGHLTRRTATDVANARQLLRQLVAEAPDFAPGHAELAVAELLASEYGLTSDAEALAAADQASRRALELDPGNGLAYAARGLAAMVEGRYRDAVPIMLDAHRREPGHDAVLLWLGNAELYSGRPQAARRWLETAAEINPDLASARISLGEADCLADVQPACDEFLNRTAETAMHAYVAALLIAHRGDPAGAIERLQRAPPEVSAAWIADLQGDACRALGRADCARAIGTAAREPLPDADLWQLDLGFSAYLRDPDTRARHANGIRAETARLRDGGVKLAVLDAIDACLDARAPVDEDDAMLMRLVGCESSIRRPAES